MHSRINVAIRVHMLAHPRLLCTCRISEVVLGEKWIRPGRGVEETDGPVDQVYPSSGPNLSRGPVYSFSPIINYRYSIFVSTSVTRFSSRSAMEIKIPP
jgi:hypothetical protein